MTTSAPIDVRPARASDPPTSYWQSYKRVMTHTHTYSGRSDHGGTVLPPRSYSMLVEWAQQVGIEAVGMGSPYTPGSIATYRQYDQHAYQQYHQPSFNPRLVRSDDEIARMLDEVNAISGGRTLFYLDNETPKARYGHLWWVGYHLDFPAWHDYDQPFDRWMCRHATPGDDGDEPMPYERRPYRQIVALQRAAGALGFWAHPTSWWRDAEGRFITNIAAEMPAHAIADGYVDGMVIMGYRSWRPEYMDVWFMLLDAGFRVTGVAEEDSGLSSESLWQRGSAMTNHVYIDQSDLTVPALVKGFAAGRLSASNGPLLELTVDGRPMGSVASTSGRTHHQATLRLDTLGAVGRLDLVGHSGQTLWSRDVNGPTTAKVNIPGRDRRGYLIARFVADGDRRDRPAAISNPVYLHPPGQGFEAPARTELRLKVTSDSPCRGGRISFEQADGAAIGAAQLTQGTIRETLPASGRFTITAADGTSQTRYLINANPELTRLQRHLYRGRFLRDRPELKPGEVPPECWQLDKFAQAMGTLELDL